MEWLALKSKAIILIFIVFACALILVSYKISTIPKHKDPTCIMLNAIKDNNISISEGFEIVNTIHKECYANNVPIPLVLAMIDVESSFRSKVISSKKAHGLMQIRKEAWDDAAGKLGIFLSHRDSRDAQWVKVKEDCEAIGVSVARLARDVGPCLNFNGTGPCTKTNRVDALYSDGPDVTPADMAGDAVADFYGADVTATELNWHKADSRGDSMEHQLVDNGGGPGYPSPWDLVSHLTPGPSFGLGWRGAYLSPPIGPDPWGHRYLVNTVFLAAASDAPPPVPGRCPAAGRTTPSASRPGPTGCTRRRSVGNATHGVYHRGDDFIYVISGDTR